MTKSRINRTLAGVVLLGAQALVGTGCSDPGGTGPSKPGAPPGGDSARPSLTDAVVVDVGQGAVALSGDEVKPRLSSLDMALAPVRHGAAPRGAVEVARSPTWLAWQEQMAQKPSNERVRVLITMDEVPYEWQRIRSAANDIEQDARVEERRGQVSAVTSPVVARLAALGATEVVEPWITTSVEATVNAGDVATIAAWPGVNEVMNATATERHHTEYTDAYSGLEARNGMRTTAFISNGITGISGGESGGAVRVGLLESSYDFVDGSDTLDWQHRGFIYCDASGACSYRASVDTCANGACTQLSSAPDNYSGTPTHANLVMQVMGGSIESGSDGNVTDPTERIRRSGIAPRTNLYRYSTTDGLCSTDLAALQKAITDKVDVLDFSSTMDVGCAPCDRKCSFCSFNTALANLRTSGTLWVTVMGNDQATANTCNVGYPSERRDGLTVGELDTAGQSTAYDTAIVRTASMRGGVDLNVYNEGVMPGAMSVADLVAPGCWTYQYYIPPLAGYAPNAPSPGNFGCGTSFAAPAVAGAAALLKQDFATMGWSSTDAGVLLVNMLLMGDGYAYYNAKFGSPAGFDPRSGAGRVHMHYPSGANLKGPWGWGWHTVDLANGQQASYTVGSAAAESPSITQWKVAMTWFETNYDQAADIYLTVTDSCNGNALVAQDASWDFRKRVELFQSHILEQVPRLQRGRLFGAPRADAPRVRGRLLSVGQRRQRLTPVDRALRLGEGVPGHVSSGLKALADADGAHGRHQRDLVAVRRHHGFPSAGSVRNTSSVRLCRNAITSARSWALIVSGRITGSLRGLRLPSPA